MKGKFDAYVLWPLFKRVQNWIIARSTARDFKVCIFEIPISTKLTEKNSNWKTKKSHAAKSEFKQFSIKPTLIQYMLFIVLKQEDVS